MAWKIFVRPGWHNDGFRRAGMDFSKEVPVVVDELTPGLEKEKAKADAGRSASVFAEVEVDEGGSSSGGYSFRDLSAMNVADLRELAEASDIVLDAKAKKAEIVDTLFAAIGDAEVEVDEGGE